MIDTQLLQQMTFLAWSSCNRVYSNENDPDNLEELGFIRIQLEYIQSEIEQLSKLKLTEEEQKAVKAVGAYSLTDPFWNSDTLKHVDKAIKKLSEVEIV